MEVEQEVEEVFDPVEEFLWTARSGELEDLKTYFLQVPTVNCVDSTSGSTALHMACANGHADCVEFLINQKDVDPNLLNFQKSAPLHWAVQNDQVKCCEILCQHPQTDVLLKNGQGKGSTSLAIEKGNTEIVKILLEHPSAASLEPPNKDGKVNSNEEEMDGEMEEEEEDDVQIHDSTFFYMKNSLDKNPYFLIREVGIRPKTLEELAEGDAYRTHLTIWAASIILARWCARDIKPAGLNILELGAGCGLPGIVAHRCCKPSKVLLTDLKVSKHLEFNIKTAKKKFTKSVSKSTKKIAIPPIQMAAINWLDPSTLPEEWVGNTEVLIGSDLVYDLDLVEPLVNTCAKLSKANTGKFYYVTAIQDRAGLDKFLTLMKEHFVLEAKIDPPKEFLKNPLDEEHSELFELHLSELRDVQHVMLLFRRL